MEECGFNQVEDGRFEMKSLLPWIPLIPLLMAVLIRFGASRRSAPGFAVVAALGTFALTALVAGREGFSEILWRRNWFQVGTELIPISLRWDGWSGIMALVVSGVALLVVVYSTEYMKEEPERVRYYATLSFFSGAMLTVVLANHLLLLFMAWEVVGLASYLLIGFWHRRPSAGAAAQKAFLLTRLGDLAFLAGLIGLWEVTGALEFYHEGQGLLESGTLQLLSLIPGQILGVSVVGMLGFLILIGAFGKSGQFPLHGWLPDAMEGPTPVSALIHAATMVAAGVFLLVRLYPLIALDAAVLNFMAWIGLFTALMGGVGALGTFDLKRGLAYSTVSQLGLMMAGLGWGGPGVAMFHLFTHAFFKALLFLTAGSIIHGCGGEQDLRKLGGLGSRLRGTMIWYAIGSLALVGIFPMAGFFSKEGILSAMEQSGVLPWGLLVTVLTGFYTARQAAYLFRGEYRGDGVPHDSSAAMQMPMMILAGGAMVAGGASGWFLLDADHGMIPWMATAAALLGGLGGFWCYRSPNREDLAGRWGVLEEGITLEGFYKEVGPNTLGMWGQLAQWVEFLIQAIWLWIRFFAKQSSLLLSGIVEGFGFQRGMVEGSSETIRRSAEGVLRFHRGQLVEAFRWMAIGAVILGICAWRAQ